MKAKDEAIAIYNEIASIEFTNSIEFETGWSDVDVDIPDLAIKEIACGLIDRMGHIANSITEEYWKEVKKEINNLEV